jgi:hypothetical protein
MSDRKFGIELEIIGGDHRPSAIARALTDAGIDCRFEGYNHETRSTWKIVSDASLSGVNACELVSPPLFGRAGFDQVTKVCAVLATLGVTVNSSCGFHCHIDAVGATLDQLKNITKMWAKYEAPALSCLPGSRRRSNWAAPLFSNMNQADAFKKVEQAAPTGATPYQFIQRLTYGGRYYTMNLQAWVRQGTIEFRSHGGTTEAEKILNWVRLCLRIVSDGIDRQRVSPKGYNDFRWMLDGMPLATKAYFTARRDLFARNARAA